MGQKAVKLNYISFWLQRKPAGAILVGKVITALAVILENIET
jgi:hypothetical protein